MTSVTADIKPDDLDRIAAALGPAAGLAYSPPHDYPMSVPAFITSPCADRQHPPSERLRLYVHVPFCHYACSYCFYAKRVGATREQMQRYVKALKRELEWIKLGTPLSQLFVGGGTPTVLPADLLDSLLAAIFERTSCDNGQVHTVETSPESITDEHIRVLQARGVERVSMGIQSLDGRVLDRVHRHHSAEQALEACRLLVQSGMILNVDLIYGLPGQTEASFHRDVELVAAQGVHSMTLYDLRLNESTSVAKMIDDDERLNLAKLVRWRAFIKQTAGEFGFTQTRWHTFKRVKSKASRHERAPCFNADGIGYQLGIGMSARSQLGYTMYRNHKRFNVYLERVEQGHSPVEEILTLREADRKTQFIARSLGDGQPLDRGVYQRAFGCCIDDDFGESLQRLRDNGLVDDDGECLYLTQTGKLVYDRVTVAFYPPHALAWLGERQPA